MLKADLTDIPIASYPAAMPSHIVISEEENSSINKKLRPFGAAGSNSIPFS
jgi:hypothetical protein